MSIIESIYLILNLCTANFNPEIANRCIEFNVECVVFKKHNVDVCLDYWDL